MREPLYISRLIRRSFALYGEFFLPLTLLAIILISIEVLIDHNMRFGLLADYLSLNVIKIEYKSIILNSEILNLILVAFPLYIIIWSSYTILLTLAASDINKGKRFVFLLYIRQGIRQLPLVATLYLLFTVIITLGILILVPLGFIDLYLLLGLA